MLKDDELLHKWVNDELSEEELAEFKKRPNYAALETLKTQIDLLSPPPFDEERILKQILSNKKQKSERKGEKAKTKTRSIFRLISYAAAAAVLLGIVWFMWPESSIVRMELANGEKIEGFLPDESLFALNAGSTLSYDTETWSSDRTLQLEGEAYFEVKKGSTFQVKTDNGTVKVLGTQFNVRSREGTLEVKCKEGKVAVLSSGGVLLEELELNDALRIQSGKIVEQWTFDGQTTDGWVSGNTSFKKVPLKAVLEELERQFDININSSKVNVTEVISCNFQHQNLELALTTVLGPLDISFEVKTNGAVILSK